MSATKTVTVDGKAKVVDVEGERLEVTPLGAGCEVGRSCVIVTFKGRTIMFDCGIHPAHTGMSTLPYFDFISCADVDLCLVTHFHIDHSGAVPYLLGRTEFNGRVFMTHPTKPICRLLWQDYARVSRTGAEEALYSRADIDKALERLELLSFHQVREHKGIKISCYSAGHVLGACMFLVEINGVRVLYTGDFSREKDRHLPQAEIPPMPIHVLIVESTYSTSTHEARDTRDLRFINAVMEVMHQGGKCLMPVFALGRAQELLLILEEHWAQHEELHEIPIYYASPMAIKCHRIFETYTNMCSAEVREAANNSSNPWVMKYVKSVPEKDDLYQLLSRHA